MIPLELLSVYLPYKLMFLTPKHQFKYGTQESILMTGLSVNLGEIIVEFLRNDDLEFSNTMKWFKPLLHPLSNYKDINSEHMNNLGIDLPDKIWINELANGWISVFKMPFNVIQIMAKNHIDMFSIIDKGLAEQIKLFT